MWELTIDPDDSKKTRLVETPLGSSSAEVRESHLLEFFVKDRVQCNRFSKTSMESPKGEEGKRGR